MPEYDNDEKDGILIEKDGKKMLIQNYNDNRQIITSLNTKGRKNSNLKLLVKVRKLTDGNITNEEIGEIQDLDGKLTEMNDKLMMFEARLQQYKEANDERSYEALKIEYDKLKGEFKEQVAELSKKIYNISKNKRKSKATFATHEYLMSRINKLK